MSDTTDRFGLRRVILDWRLTPLEKRTIRKGTLEIAKYMAQQDLGRVKLYDWVLDEEHPGFPPPIDDLVGRNHHRTRHVKPRVIQSVSEDSAQVTEGKNKICLSASV